MDEIRGRQAETEKKLARLGVHKIDPNDADDVKRLMEIMGSEATENSYEVKGAGEKSSTPPDFSALATKYSIYQQYGSYTVNGTSYQYTYIHVIDNKNQSTPLTVSNLFAMYGKQSTLLSNLLAYQFSFAVSAFWGTIPYGTLIDWTLGTVFTILQSMGGNSNVVCSGNQNIYTLSLLSVTHMLYIYTYTNANGWALSGSRAPDISFARADSFVANVQGTAVSDAKSSSWNSSTGNGITWYVTNYINTGVAVYSTPGSLFAKRGSVNVGTFSPGFCSVPGYL